MGGVGPFRPWKDTAEKPLPDADNFGFAGIDRLHLQAVALRRHRSQAVPALQKLTPSAYIKGVIRVRPGDYGDKRLCNKQPGPGGSTRRLHHKPSEAFWRRRVSVGAKQDRRMCKGSSFARYGSAVIGLLFRC